MLLYIITFLWLNCQLLLVTKFFDSFLDIESFVEAHLLLRYIVGHVSET